MLKANNTKVKVFGLKATETQLVLTIIVNTEAVVEHKYGCAFCAPLKIIHSQFKYDYKYDVTSLKNCIYWQQQTPTGKCVTRQRPPSCR